MPSRATEERRKGSPPLGLRPCARISAVMELRCWSSSSSASCSAIRTWARRSLISKRIICQSRTKRSALSSATRPAAAYTIGTNLSAAVTKRISRGLLRDMRLSRSIAPGSSGSRWLVTGCGSSWGSTKYGRKWYIEERHTLSREAKTAPTSSTRGNRPRRMETSSTGDPVSRLEAISATA